MKRALLSVADKTGITDFAAGLRDLGFEIISTGTTQRVLAAHGIPVKPVEEFTGFPELLGGRLKTLHPKVHGGILAIRDDPAHAGELEKHGIETIDLVANNLYPFKETVSKPDVTLKEAIEQIDVGGPSMLRAAAKNHDYVTVLCDPGDYPGVLEELKQSGKVSGKTNLNLAAKAFMHTAHYDAMVADYFKSFADAPLFPETLTLTYEKIEDLRYGENPHQKAAFYREASSLRGTLADLKQLHGKDLSFCNINDTDGALNLIREFDEPAAVIVKHATPCGVGCGESVYEAYIRAYESDPKSVHGGIIVVNREVDEKTAREINKLLIDIVLAPSFTQDAFKILSQKRNIRLLTLNDMEAKRGKSSDIKKVSGGLLIQDTDDILLPEIQYTVPTKRRPSLSEADDLIFAWKIVKHVKSNGIVIGKNKQSLGIGGGQVNRIWAANQAIEHCVEALGVDILRGAALASDAFFPFPDCVEAAHKAGITAIIQPGGSVNDAQSIEACDKFGIAMAFTHLRHFKH